LIEAKKEKLAHKSKMNDENIVNQTPTRTNKTKNHATPARNLSSTKEHFIVKYLLIHKGKNRMRHLRNEKNKVSCDKYIKKLQSLLDIDKETSTLLSKFLSLLLIHQFKPSLSRLIPPPPTVTFDTNYNL
jgi:hypothetical protein